MFNKLYDDYDDYETKTIINGQTVKVTFWRLESKYKRNKFVYSVYLRILDKKKKDHFESLSINNKGSTGLKGLLYAKEQILDFVDFIKKEKNINEVEFCIGWEDNRRRRVYERGLKDLGFRYNMINYDGVNNKCLYCKL